MLYIDAGWLASQLPCISVLNQKIKIKAESPREEREGGGSGGYVVNAAIVLYAFQPQADLPQQYAKPLFVPRPSYNALFKQNHTI